MGIQIEPVLILGWNISYDKLMKYLKDNNAESCLRKDKNTEWSIKNQCLCGPTFCWSKNKEFKFQYDFVKTSPCYDCCDEDCNLYLSILPEFSSQTSLKNLCIGTIDIEDAKKFAILLGAENIEPRIFAEYNIS